MSSSTQVKEKLQANGPDLLESFLKHYSGHKRWQSLEIYSKLSLTDAQQEYDQVMGRFPIQ